MHAHTYMHSRLKKYSKQVQKHFEKNEEDVGLGVVLKI